MDPAGNLVLNIVATGLALVVAMMISLFVVLWREDLARAKAAKRVHTVQEEIFDLHM